MCIVCGEERGIDVDTRSGREGEIERVGVGGMGCGGRGACRGLVGGGTAWAGSAAGGLLRCGECH